MQSPASSPGVGSEVKFVFTAVGQAGQDLQLQEVELFGPSGQLAVLSATNPGGAAANGQVADRAIDGNKVDKWSKWFDDNMDTRGNSTLVRVRVRVRVRLRVRVGVRVKG